VDLRPVLQLLPGDVEGLDVRVHLQQRQVAAARDASARRPGRKRLQPGAGRASSPPLQPARPGQPGQASQARPARQRSAVALTERRLTRAAGGASPRSAFSTQLRSSDMAARPSMVQRREARARPSSMASAPAQGVGRGVGRGWRGCGLCAVRQWQRGRGCAGGRTAEGPRRRWARGLRRCAGCCSCRAQPWASLQQLPPASPRSRRAARPPAAPARSRARAPLTPGSAAAACTRRPPPQPQPAALARPPASCHPPAATACSHICALSASGSAAGASASLKAAKWRCVSCAQGL
jgi:hypothetical protein